MTVISITRPIATLAESISAGVSVRLQMPVYDDRLVALAASRGHVAPDVIASLDEIGRSILRRPADLWQMVPMPPIDPELPDVIRDAYAPTGPVRTRGGGLDAPRYWAGEAYATLMTRTIRDLASREDCIIVGRGGFAMIPQTVGLLRVLCIASDDTRVRRLVETHGVSEFEAGELLRESDRTRGDYHRQFLGVDWREARGYDVVINTDLISVTRAVDLIASVAPVFVRHPDHAPTPEAVHGLSV